MATQLHESGICRNCKACIWIKNHAPFGFKADTVIADMLHVAEMDGIWQKLDW